MKTSLPLKRPYLFNRRRLPVFLLLFCSLFFFQCKKEITTTSSSAKLAFSSNLVFFDTVFVSQGSSVRIFVVHNNNNEAVVTSIKLQGSYTSPFQINVDGLEGTNFNNVKIPAHDSIYVFTQVNINPLNVNNPSLIRDSLVFTTNGNIQWVDLAAYGWNAYYYYPNIFPATGPAYSQINATDSVWKSDKPHVVFGYLVVPQGHTLSIDAGTGVYMHDSAVILVDSTATLNINGSGNNGGQVTIQGDRLEPAYKNLPGQWNEIFLYKTGNCRVSWAVIQNGSIGIQVDTVEPGNAKPALTMDHTIIKGMSEYGLLGLGAPVTANNCLIADCQNSCVGLFYGGTYSFYQCTLADYWSYSSRSTPLLYLNNHYQSASGQNIYRPIYKAFFGNCIIYGTLDDEIKFDSITSPQDSMSYAFVNCLLKTTQSFSGKRIPNSIANKDPLFYNTAADNYRINNGSPAQNNGNPNFATMYPTSLDNLPWSSINMGAYEQ